MPWLPRSRRSAARPPAAKNAQAAREIAYLHENVPLWGRLPPRQLPAAYELVERFLAEKQFWGSQNLAVTDEIKLITAAVAVIPVLKLDRLGLYPRTREVIVYPGTFGPVVEAVAPDGERMQIADLKAGETWRRGPVLLSWDQVESELRGDAPGANTIIHEFAHALDLLTGEANGVPPLESPEQHAEWAQVWTREYDSFCVALQHGRRSLLDPYAATNPAEFFAVASEMFFELPRRMRAGHRSLYEQLKRFYLQDPASW